MSRVLAAVLGWLINQLPAIPQFPGQKALILKLTFELVVLGVVFSWLKDFSKDSEDWIKVSARTVGCMVLLLFVWHTSQLLWKLWQTKQYSNELHPNTEHYNRTENHQMIGGGNCSKQ